jgi:hypothetical protein
MGKNKKKNANKKVDSSDPEALKVGPTRFAIDHLQLGQNLGNEE